MIDKISLIILITMKVLDLTLQWQHLGNWEKINEKIKKQLIDVQTIQDGSDIIKGMVYANDTDEIDKSRIFYIQHNPEKVAYSWHMITHELAHFIGKPDSETIENEINSNSNESQLGGTELFDFTTNTKYGTCLNECGADLLCEMAMTTSKECRDTNPKIQTADDIIYTNNRYQKTDYDSLSTIARLMVVAMDNNFSNQSYDQMIHGEEGLIDRKISITNQETGEIVENVPVNDYLYAMSGHGKHLEKSFDRYSEDGSYRQLCSFLDEELKEIVKNPNHTINKDKIKEQMLRIAGVVNNKMNTLQNNKCITVEQRNAFVGKFNKVFNQALLEYGIGALSQEDMQFLQNSIANNQTNVRNRQNTDKTIKDSLSNSQIESESPYEEYINEFCEVIRPEGKNDNFQIDSSIPTFEPPIEKSLSFKQKIAMMLQNSELLMKIPFIRKFADKQLNVLPPPTQDTKLHGGIINQSRVDFMNEISNFGAYRNLPPIKRMSDPERLAQMQRKMKENQQSNDGNERG